MVKPLILLICSHDDTFYLRHKVYVCVIDFNKYEIIFIILCFVLN